MSAPVRKPARRPRAPARPQAPAAKKAAAAKRAAPGGKKVKVTASARVSPARRGGDGSKPSLRAAPARRPSRKRAAVAPRLDVAGNDPSRSLAQLVLTLVELLRQILERQAVRRLQTGSLGDEEIERMGQSFMKLERAVRRMCREFGLRFEDLRLPLRQVD